MNSVERVKLICKERKIPISKLERDLGYANGYIGQLRKGVFPADRLTEIAKYLSVTPEYLMTGEETKTAPAETGKREVSDEDIMFALSRGHEEVITEEMYEEVKRFADYLIQREAMKKKKEG